MGTVFTRTLAFLNLEPTMTRVQSPFKRGGALLAAHMFCVFVLTGCQSAGKQYAFPKASEPAATAVGTSQFYLVNSDHTGCYWGRTAVDANEPVRLTPDVLTQVGHDAHLDAPYPIGMVKCVSFSNFKPRQGEHYVVKYEGVPTIRTADGKWVLGRCGTGVWRHLPTGELERVPDEPRPAPTRRGFACLMPEKVSAEKQ